MRFILKLFKHAVTEKDIEILGRVLHVWDTNVTST